MSKNPAINGLLAIAIVCGFGAPVGAQADVVAKVLAIRPKCDDVAMTTPAPADIAKCSVETPKGASGYLLLDANKQPLRKFLDTDADGRVDTWSYYQDGAEVYREAVVGKAYSFRWMGANGMKWGIGSIDQAGKARIETWRMISADEAAQEAFQALATGDFERMKALMIAPEEMKALGLPGAEAQRLVALQQAAPAKFQKVRGALPNLPQATFSRLENAKPGSYPADMTGGTLDIVKIPSGLILYENAAGPKKHDFISAPQIVQVGNAWRITDVPSNDPAIGLPNQQVPVALLNELQDHDKIQPPLGKKMLGPWTLKRIAIVEKIAAETKGEERENWLKQISDNLAAAVVDGDNTLTPVLAKWKDHFATTAPAGKLAPYFLYREIWSTYQFNIKDASNNLYPKITAAYHDNLAKFIQAYPTAGDVPDALIQIATNADFTGNDDEAKKLYGQIVANFPDSLNASKAIGAIRRIDSVGKNFVLTGPTLENRNYTLNPGKITVVYYWASYSNQVAGDFAAFKKLQQTFANDLDIVTVNLDDKPAAANAFLQQSPLKAPHLHQPAANGGTESPLAAYYGIFGLPHVFLIDAGGRVVSNKAQVNSLEDEITKLTKK